MPEKDGILEKNARMWSSAFSIIFPVVAIIVTIYFIWIWVGNFFYFGNQAYNVATGDTINASKLETDVYKEINLKRKEYGLSPISLDYPISSVARRYATEMAQQNRYGHVDFFGGHFYNRIEGMGLTCNGGAENLARLTYFTYIPGNEETAKKIIETWMDSDSGHRYSILNEKYSRVGIGVYHGPATSCYYDSDSSMRICDDEVNSNWNQIIVVADFCS